MVMVVMMMDIILFFIDHIHQTINCVILYCIFIIFTRIHMYKYFSCLISSLLQFGYSALIWASYYDYAEIGGALLGHGADVKLKSYVRNKIVMIMVIMMMLLWLLMMMIMMMMMMVIILIVIMMIMMISYYLYLYAYDCFHLCFICDMTTIISCISYIVQYLSLHVHSQDCI